MGLFRALFPKKMKDAVRGTAQVVSCSGTSENATYQTCQMQLVVTVEGIEPYAVEHTQIMKASRWPMPGMSVPVTVSRSEPTNLRIETDEIPDWQDVGMDRAEQIAAAMRGDDTATPQITPLPGGGGTVQVVNLSGDPVAAEAAISMAEQATGMDLNADGKVGSGAAPPAGAGAAPAAGDDDRIAQIERLAKLRDSGALSSDEFEAEKARILGTTG